MLLLFFSSSGGWGKIKSCVYVSGGFVFFPWGIPQLQSDWSLSCDHGLDYPS